MLMLFTSCLLLCFLKFSTASLYFQIPANSGDYPVNSQVAAIVSSTQPGLSEIGTITQNCKGDIVTLPAELNIPTIFNLPFNFIGQCFYTADFSPLSPPAQVYIDVMMSVQITEPATPPSFVVAAGESFDVKLATAPFTTTQPNFEVQLDCGIPGVLPASQNISANLAVGTPFSVPQTFYGSNCLLRVLDFTYKYLSTNIASIIVTEQLEFTSPNDNSTSIVPDPITVYLSTGQSLLVTNVTARLECAESKNGIDFSMRTSTNEVVSISSEFYGNCSLSVPNPPEYLIAPTSVYFNRVFGSTFLKAPSTLVIGNPFQVEIGASRDVANPPGVKFSLEIYCNSSEPVYKWNEFIDLYVLKTFVTPISLLPYPNCTLQAIPQVDFFLPAETNVSVKYISSPFGGDLYPITREETQSFLKSIYAPGDQWRRLTRSFFE